MHEKILSCDWGTSSFRLLLIDIASGKIIAESFSDEGIALVYALWKNSGNDERKRIDFYLAVIREHIHKIEQYIKSSTANTPVIISGMASATIGMMELPYATFPFSLNGENLQYKKLEKTNAFDHDAVIISGVQTDADVMRGEETQLMGCAGNETTAKQLFIFTGTHAKHVSAMNGKAVDLTTYMTGEFFELLSKKSILSDSVAAGESIEKNENKKAFEQGVKDSLQHNLLHSSFMVRTNQLFKRFSKSGNYFYLSGLLIGTELNQLPGKEGGALIIVGEQKLVMNYLLALKVLGIDKNVTTENAATATILGQIKIYKRLYNS